MRHARQLIWDNFPSGGYFLLITGPYHGHGSFFLITKIERLTIANVGQIIPPDAPVDGIRANNSNLGGLAATNSRRREAKHQKKGTNSLTIITGAICMYNDIYLCGRGGVRNGASALGLPSESDEQKAKHFDEGMITSAVVGRGIAGRRGTAVDRKRRGRAKCAQI